MCSPSGLSVPSLKMNLLSCCLAADVAARALFHATDHPESEEGLRRRAMMKGYEEGLCPKRLVRQKLFDTFKSFLSLVLYLKSQCRASYGFFAPSYLVFSVLAYRLSF